MSFKEDLKHLYHAEPGNTADEIRQEPRLWLETCEIVKNQKAEITDFIADYVKAGSRIILTGAGTSDYVGDTVVTTINKLVDAQVEAIATTDIVSSPYEFIEEDVPTLLVSFARSGNSPESIGAYDLFQENIKKVGQLVITCAAEGELAKRADAGDNALTVLMPDGSNDKGFAMTSSYSCMTLASLLVFDLDRLEENTTYVKAIASQGDTILDTRYDEVQKMVDYGCSRVVYLGSGFLGQMCQEMALKNMELTSGKVLTFNESVMGFRHGPKSIINDDTMVVILMSGDPYTRVYDLDLVDEINGDDGEHKLVVISYDADATLADRCDQFIEIGGAAVPEIFKCFNYLLFGQLFGLFNSMKHGITPDNPRPDGTVNRVVKGVTIHPYKG